MRAPCAFLRYDSQRTHAPERARGSFDTRRPRVTKKLKRFVRGMGSVMDIAPPRREIVPLHRTDAEALRGDFQAVGDDIRRSMNKADRRRVDKKAA